VSPRRNLDPGDVLAQDSVSLAFAASPYLWSIRSSFGRQALNPEWSPASLAGVTAADVDP